MLTGIERIGVEDCYRSLAWANSSRASKIGIRECSGRSDIYIVVLQLYLSESVGESSRVDVVGGADSINSIRFNSIEATNNVSRMILQQSTACAYASICLQSRRMVSGVCVGCCLSLA